MYTCNPSIRNWRTEDFWGLLIVCLAENHASSRFSERLKWMGEKGFLRVPHTYMYTYTICTYTIFTCSHAQV